MTTKQAFELYRAVLQSLREDTLDTLDSLVSPDIRFKDPLHETVGADRMKDVFAGLFRSAADINYVVDDYACSANAVYFRWTLTGQLSGNPWTVTGVTRAAFNEDGRVTDHVEYWDAASQLYERFPVIGSLLRFVRRRIACP